jgi:hypothetical protein
MNHQGAYRNMVGQRGSLDHLPCQFVQGRNCWPPSPRSYERVKVIHGANDELIEGFIGISVAQAHRTLAVPFNIPNAAVAFVNGTLVRSSYRVRKNDCLEFVVPWGRKGADDGPSPEAGRLLTVKEAAAEMHCSISFIYKVMAAGQLSYERRGRRKLPLAVSVAEYRQRTRHSATNQPSRPKKSPKQPYQYQRLFCDKSSGDGK